MLIKTRLFDRVLFLLSLGVSIVSGIFIYRTPSESSVVVIESEESEWMYPLDKNAIIEISGKIGTTIVEIKDGAVCIIDSPCPLRTCVSHGAIHSAGMPLVCLPNAVCVTIRGGAHDNDFDAVSY